MEIFDETFGMKRGQQAWTIVVIHGDHRIQILSGAGISPGSQCECPQETIRKWELIQNQEQVCKGIFEWMGCGRCHRGLSEKDGIAAMNGAAARRKSADR